MKKKDRFGRKCNTCQYKGYSFDRFNVVIVCQKHITPNSHGFCMQYTTQGKCGKCVYWQVKSPSLRVCTHPDSPRFKEFPNSHQGCHKFSAF